MNSHTSSKKTGYAMRQQSRVTLSELQAICWLFLAALIFALVTLTVSFLAFTASETLLFASSLQLKISCLALASAACLAAWAFSTAVTLDMLTSFLVSERRS